MNPNTVLSASLVTSLILWFPSMQACLRGDLDLGAAGLRYLAALVVSRLAMKGLARLVNVYRAAQEPAAPSPDGLSAGPAQPGGSEPARPRRRDDAAGGNGDPTTLAA